MNVPAPQMVQLPVKIEHDDVVDASGWVADVDIGHWFPYGAKYTRVVKMPGASRRLSNQFTVLTSRRHGRAAVNYCALGLFRRAVRGNILVIRHQNRSSELATNLHPCEKQFVHIIVDK